MHMGLFRRDERSAGNNPSPADAQAQHKGDGSTVTLVAKSNHVEGQISGAGEVRIEGHFKGRLDGPSKVLVAEGGQVEAEIHASVVTAAGHVRGDIFAAKKIELTPTADVQGDITAPRILIRDGATFEGQVYMRDPDKREAVDPASVVDPKQTDSKPSGG
jgi:cytoskeletal protein CcmA (bactofilin family)